jgi:hypothetical protein
VIAVIGDGGYCPVVWGLGETLDAALADARFYAGDVFDWTAEGWVALKVTPHIVAKIAAGVIDCERLGISITLKHGRIVHAELSAALSLTN